MNRRTLLQRLTFIMGGVLSAPTLMAIELGNQTHLNIEGNNTLNLIEIDKEVLAEIAEMIIPRTDTSGAKDANVPEFIVRMIQDCYGIKDQENFKLGLGELRTAGFLIKSKSERVEVLKKLENEAKSAFKLYAEEQQDLVLFPYAERFDRQTIPIPFWRLIKELTLLGYFTSEICVNESFDYTPIPGRLAFVKYKKGQKLYSY